MEGKYRVRYHSRIVLLQEKRSSNNKTLLKNHPIIELLMQDNVYYERISTDRTGTDYLSSPGCIHVPQNYCMCVLLCTYIYAIVYEHV